MSFEVIIPFLRPIKHLLDADTVSEIMVNPDGSVWIEEGGAIQLLLGICFEEGALQTGLEVIANRFAKKLDIDSPIMNLRLPDGSRMAAIIPPVVNPGPLMTIRKFTSRNFTISDLIRNRMLNEDQAEKLTCAVREGKNILIAGGTGSGKTTLLNVLSDAIPNEHRILTIEDTAELSIRKPHIVSTESQTDTYRGQISFDDLLKAGLRHRPDRIIVGEVRGVEARTLLDAMNTGHRGTLATIHASGCIQAIVRLAALADRVSAKPGIDATEREVRNSLDLVAFISRSEGHRHIEEILYLAGGK